jgi:uncharacterized protein (TIGR02996 family)
MSSDEAALLQAVIATPDDDLPRLVYADWLDERGDPRGEYIRLQVEITRAAPHTDQYAALRGRLKALRATVPPAWVEAMGYRPRHRPLFAVLPERRADRWRLVDEFIEVWHRPLDPGDGYTEGELREAEQRLGCGLPAALREWYSLAGRRADVWSVQDHLPPPDQLRIDSTGNTLIVRSENQGCEHWGIRVADLGRDDPPIWVVGSGVQASPTTTAFACLVLLYEARFAPEVVWAVGGLEDERVRAKAARGLSRCDLPDQYWGGPIRLYEGVDIILYYHGEAWVHVAARGEDSYRQLDEEVRSHLEVYEA